ncbi:Uncharacterised protein [Vibrio cholerae]|uniref:Uncharacterized protein n=1 Tax=Vibrio cholerae TaxID=666 RepID=A0A655ZTY3_VIBCL|nr:Uncharacterised protein [Vibrio cholerae]CSC82822.1 Uncharacterised protein [Vibrio cholerae]CSC86836.1 Uncharacterised protein [Vibrio cholerae]CSD23489.1 Uncharacterised protein [Vibrio cholerae]
MATPTPRHHSGHAIDGTFIDVCARYISKIFTREDGVRVTKSNRVNTFDLGQVVNRVFCASLVFIGADPRVGDGDNHIRAFGFHLRDKFFCGLFDIGCGHFTFEIFLIPHHDLWRNKSDITDLDGMCLSIGIFKAVLFNHIRRE